MPAMASPPLRGTGRTRTVQFTRAAGDAAAGLGGGDTDKESPRRQICRSQTTPLDTSKGVLGGELLQILHLEGRCKPCAFYYSKKKSCQYGELCEFCHHEDHSRLSLKQWKKQQRKSGVLGVAATQESLSDYAPYHSFNVPSDPGTQSSLPGLGGTLATAFAQCVGRGAAAPGGYSPCSTGPYVAPSPFTTHDAGASPLGPSVAGVNVAELVSALLMKSAENGGTLFGAPPAAAPPVSLPPPGLTDLSGGNIGSNISELLTALTSEGASSPSSLPPSTPAPPPSPLHDTTGLSTALSSTAPNSPAARSRRGFHGPGVARKAFETRKAMTAYFSSSPTAYSATPFPPPPPPPSFHPPPPPPSQLPASAMSPVSTSFSPAPALEMAADPWEIGGRLGGLATELQAHLAALLQE